MNEKIMNKMLSFAELQPGDTLPELEIPITAKLIVSGAIASQDYYEVHHDRDFAKNLGSPDIFMNILTTNGLVGRYLSDWSGPRARLKKIAIRLGAPNYPGDIMHLEGAITAKDAEQRNVEITFRGNNSIGQHVSGSATVHFPQEKDS